jgi:hypothetical protein
MSVAQPPVPPPVEVPRSLASFLNKDGLSDIEITDPETGTIYK